MFSIIFIVAVFVLVDFVFHDVISFYNFFDLSYFSIVVCLCCIFNHCRCYLDKNTSFLGLLLW